MRVISRVEGPLDARNLLSESRIYVNGLGSIIETQDDEEEWDLLYRIKRHDELNGITDNDRKKFNRNKVLDDLGI